QATREVAGGEMVRYLAKNPLPNESYIYSRIGDQGRVVVAAVRRRGQPAAPGSAPVAPLLSRLRAMIRKRIIATLFGPAAERELEVGRFRLTSGQVSYCMYDRYSLRQLFENSGLSDVAIVTSSTSRYPLWQEVNLDLSQNGGAARPHALIMEGVRA